MWSEGGVLPNLYKACFSVSERIYMLREISLAHLPSVWNCMRMETEHILSKQVSDIQGPVPRQEGSRTPFMGLRVCCNILFPILWFGKKSGQKRITGGSLLFWSSLVCCLTMQNNFRFFGEMGTKDWKPGFCRPLSKHGRPLQLLKV